MTSHIPIPASTSSSGRAPSTSRSPLPSRSMFSSRSTLSSRSPLGSRSSVALENAISLTLPFPPLRSSYVDHRSFEPRVIRAAPDSPHPSCQPPTNRSSSNLRPAASQSIPSVQHSSSPSFLRPSYLDNSAFRQLLLLEQPLHTIPSRKLDSMHTHPSALPASSDSDDDSTATPPRDTGLPPKEYSFKLPTCWSDQDRHNLLNVSLNGRELSYQGTSCGDKDAAAARTIHPIPPACGIYYYEVEILGKEHKSHISIGFAGHGVKFSRLPGWEPNSWGYHGDDGCSFAAEKNGTAYGPTYGAGDIIGCGIDFTSRRAFFTKNGSFIGPVFENVGKDIDLYPSVGLQHAGEIIRVNFGHEPFKFDIDSHVQQQRNAVWSGILTTPIDSSVLEGRSVSTTGKTALSDEQSKGVLNKLVLTYLVHHGYAKTVRAFQKQRPDVLAAQDPDIVMDGTVPGTGGMDKDIECRTRIVNSVISGDIDSAIAETKKHHPIVLESEDHLMLFKLRCRKFVELILETTEIKKRIKSLKENRAEKRHYDEIGNGDGEFWMGEEMSMDVDDDAVGLTSTSPTTIPYNASPLRNGREKAVPPDGEVKDGDAAVQYEMALNTAIAYGQELSNDYKSDTRPEVRQLFKQTFGIVAWEDPLEAGGSVASVVSYEARVNLANELNQAILKSQGRPTRPALELLYRQTAACLLQLGTMGVGTAAFADISREILES